MSVTRVRESVALPRVRGGREECEKGPINHRLNLNWQIGWRNQILSLENVLFIIFRVNWFGVPLLYCLLRARTQTFHWQIKIGDRY